MTSACSMAKAALGCALVVLATSGHAALVTYASPAAFNQAVFNPSTDNFSSLTAGSVSSPYAGTAGSYSYEAATATGNLYALGTPSAAWLSTDGSGAEIVFNNFAGGVDAIGGLFFGTDLAGDVFAGQTITLTALDSFGDTAVETIVNASADSFRGFSSTGSLVSLTVSISGSDAYATVGNLVLATVPEPGTWMLVVTGLLAGGLVRAQRRLVATTEAAAARRRPQAWVRAGPPPAC